MKGSRGRILLALLCAATWAACDTSGGVLDAEVTVHDLILGTGAIAEGNVIVTVHYAGMLATTGKVFDSSRENNVGGISFYLATGAVEDDLQNSKVIDGFVLGIPGMRVGGLRRLTVPPQLGWGSRGAGCNNPDAPSICTVPPNETLIFDIELADVRNAEE